ncbi:MAG: hypothetical protein JWQ11_4927 [Rhizobacter sp.]|nr:hypothetical protein [Rhizobacter sp.]
MLHRVQRLPIDQAFSGRSPRKKTTFFSVSTNGLARTKEVHCNIFPLFAVARSAGLLVCRDGRCIWNMVPCTFFLAFFLSGLALFGIPGQGGRKNECCIYGRCHFTKTVESRVMDWVDLVIAFHLPRSLASRYQSHPSSHPFLSSCLSRLYVVN